MFVIGVGCAETVVLDETFGVAAVADGHKVKSGSCDGGATLDNKLPLGRLTILGDGIE